MAEVMKMYGTGSGDMTKRPYVEYSLTGLAHSHTTEFAPRSHATSSSARDHLVIPLFLVSGPRLVLHQRFAP